MNQMLNQEWTNGEKKRQNSELTKPQLIKADWFMTFPWLNNKRQTVKMQLMCKCQDIKCFSQWKR